MDAVLVEEQIDIARELYLGVVIDNAEAMPVVIASAAGGMEIEQVAEETPERIHRQAIDPACGFQGYQARALAFATGLDGDLNRPAVALIQGLARAFGEQDGTLAEINPLVVTGDGRLLAADAKFSVDDDADFRRRDLAALRDEAQDDALEVEAQAAGVQNYIKLDGDIGCMVNGAGLAMATMDAIQFEGGEPANFLDIGTANDPEAIVTALRIIGADPDVKAVLVNIFGGLARTDVIAEGVVQAKREGLIAQPTVVRLAGTTSRTATASSTSPASTSCAPTASPTPPASPSPPPPAPRDASRAASGARSRQAPQGGDGRRPRGLGSGRKARGQPPEHRRRLAGVAPRVRDRAGKRRRTLPEPRPRTGAAQPRGQRAIRAGCRALARRAWGALLGPRARQQIPRTFAAQGVALRRGVDRVRPRVRLRQPGPRRG